MTDALCHLVVDGNEVLELKLVRSVNDLEDEGTSFKPDMCHQVFGDNENIFGYTDLRIKLYYSAGSLQTYLGVEYKDKIEPSKSEGMKADDVEGALQKVLAPGYETNLDNFVSLLDKDASFVPYGEHIDTFNIGEDFGDNRRFETFYSEVTTPNFLNYHQRLQTFLLWYIDAASFIDVDDDRWMFFTVFEKYKTSEGDWRYATAAYATVYRYYAYPNHIRPRISQVLVLPPFRKLGVCTHLLRTINSYFIGRPEVLDITVEDPSEDFQRIRDLLDATTCQRCLPSFQVSELKKGFTADMATQARGAFKINKKQARRVYEILRLKNTDTSDKTAYLNYRLDVKKRLNAPFQKKKLDMKKLEKVLKPEEYAATVSATGVSETQNRLDAQYTALEQQYRRVIQHLNPDPPKRYSAKAGRELYLAILNTLSDPLGGI